MKASLLSVAIGLAYASPLDVLPRWNKPVYPDYNKLDKCPGYKAYNVKDRGNSLTADLKLAGQACNAYGDDLKHLTLEVTYETDDRIHVKIQDKDNQVYQVPESIFPRPSSSSSSSSSSHHNTPNIQFKYTSHPFTFSIVRPHTHETLFDTSAASLVFESQYLRLRTSLPSDPYLYGLGEHSDPFRLNHTDYVRTFWNQDSYGIPAGANLYGDHPFYLEQRESGAHGVFFLNSNGMDVVIDQDDKGKQFLEYNTIGGVLDFYFFAGPSPVDAAMQYSEIAGFPAMQPYWALGFHQCRYGYQDAYNVAEVVYNYSQANIPLETMWTDIDYMDRRRVFSLDPDRFPLDEMQALVTKLHADQQHYIVMVDPAVAYQDYGPLHRGVHDDIFLRRDNGSLWLGVVWPGVTVFPDWFADKVAEYWDNEFAIFFDPETGVDIDSIWIDMNEPSNFPCNFPCDDPYAAAVGYPPDPPAVREPPRPLPGWPCVFQPEGTDCDDSTASSRIKRISAREALQEESLANINAHALARSHEPRAGDQKGLPGRDLLYPEYSIHNAAAYELDWNADKGGISNHTVNTDVISHNGLAMYDTHNLYGAQMSAATREAMISRRPGKRPLIVTRSTFSGAGSKVAHWLGDNLSTWDKYRVSIPQLLQFTSLFSFNLVGSDVCGFGDDTTEELCARWASLGAFSTFYRNHNSLGQIDQEFYRWDSVAEAARRAIDVRYRLMDYMYTMLRRASVTGEPAVKPVFYKFPQEKDSWALDTQYFYGDAVLVAPVLEEGSTSVDAYLPSALFYDWYTHASIQGSGKTRTIDDVPTTQIPLLILGGNIIPLRANSANTTTELRKEPFELLIAPDSHGKAKGELYLDDGESIDVGDEYSLIDFEYDNGRLYIKGEFGYEIDVGVSKVTVLGEKGGHAGCEEREDRRKDGGKGCQGKKMSISLNRASEMHI